MGTAVTFDVRLPKDGEAWHERASDAIAAGCDWLHFVDRTFTTYDSASFVSRYGRGDVELDECPGEVRAIVEQCRRFRILTGGWFDPWAGQACPFDPSGLVKGWAAQHASDLLSKAGLGRHCVNAGGDVAVRGASGAENGWGVGISHPLVPQALCAVVRAKDEGVATSGTAERGNHVWRPRDASPATDLASVTVLHPDLSVADVYATAAFAMGERATAWLTKIGVDAYVIDSGGHEWCTPGFARKRTWPAAG